YNRIVRYAQVVLMMALVLVCCPIDSPAADVVLQVTTAARAIRPGDAVLFTATTPEPLESLHVTAPARGIAAVTYRVDERKWEAVLGIDLETKPGSYVVTFEGTSDAHPVASSTTNVVTPRVFGRRVLKVDEAFVNPPRELMTRISSEAAELEGLWSHSAPDRLWHDPFVRPVPGQANSAFGSRSIFNGQPRAPHGGADFLSPAGTPVRAPNSGRVVLAR